MMKQSHHILNRLAAMLLSCAALGSCSDSGDAPGMPGDGTERVFLSFTLDTGTPGASRAYDHAVETEDPGTMMERNIVTAMSKIYVFNSGGSLVTAIPMAEAGLIKRSDTEYNITVELEKSLFGNAPSPKIDLAVVANTAGEPSGPASLADLAAHSYSFTAPGPGTEGLPMWGHATGITLTDHTNTGTIDMLRAWAKIIVKRGPALPAGYTLEASLTTACGAAYLAAPWTGSAILTGNDITAPCLPGTKTAATLATPCSTGADGTVTYYVPESPACTAADLTDSDSYTNYLTVTVKDSKGNTVNGLDKVKVPIALFSEGKATGHLPVLRNHVYEFSIDYDYKPVIKIRMSKWDYHKIIFEL